MIRDHLVPLDGNVSIGRMILNGCADGLEEGLTIQQDAVFLVIVFRSRSSNGIGLTCKVVVEISEPLVIGHHNAGHFYIKFLL